jgi:hypothetical protein
VVLVQNQISADTLGMKRPADVYVASTRSYHCLPDLSYPLHDRDIVVTACGRICMHREKIHISTVLAGQTLGIKEVDDGICQLHGLEQRTLQPLDNCGHSASCRPISGVAQFVRRSPVSSCPQRRLRPPRCPVTVLSDVHEVGCGTRRIRNLHARWNFANAASISALVATSPRAT